MMYRALLFLVSLTLVLGGCGDTVDSAPVTDSGATTSPDAGVMNVDGGSEDAESSDVDAGPELPPRPWSIREQGPYNVGWVTYDIVYDAFEEPDRMVRIAAWYPTLDADGPYSRYDNLFNRFEAFREATPEGEDLPVLIFSHGNSSLAEQSFYMTEFFASHGWLVIAPDHTGNTWTDNQGAINLSSALDRPQDITAMLDDIYARPEDDLLHGLASDDIVMSGHSFGGFTTLVNAGASFQVEEILTECESGLIDASLCEVFTPTTIERARMGFLDERIDVAIPQTPAGAAVFREGLADITIPTLLMTADRDQTLPNEEEGDPIWDYMGPNAIRLDMVNSGHFTYSNMCDFFPIDDGCGDAYIDPEIARELINAYSMAFARWHLFGVPEYEAIANGEEVIYPEHVGISTK